MQKKKKKKIKSAYAKAGYVSDGMEWKYFVIPNKVILTVMKYR